MTRQPKTAKKTAKPEAKYPRVILQHEYISVNLGNNRRLTTSFSGEKAAGAIPGRVFDVWCSWIQDTSKGETFGDRVKSFADSIDTIWPEWNAAPPKFEVGQKVKVCMGKKPEVGTVVKVRGTSVTVQLADYPISMAADLLGAWN